MKTIKKVSIKNILGVEEKEVEPKQITELTGRNGEGKTSFIDAINIAFTNKNVRSKIVKDGAETGTLYLELNDGTEVEREKNLLKNDKINVKVGGNKIKSPQTYLNNLFSSNQFRPLEFIDSDSREQKRILLSLVNIDWVKEDFIEWFKEIPNKIDWSAHILDILNFLGSDKSKWYTERHLVNQKIRSKEEVEKDLLKDVPENFNYEEAKKINLSEIYKKIEEKRNINNLIEKSKNTIEQGDLKKENIKYNYSLKIKEQDELLEFKNQRIEIGAEEKNDEITSRIDCCKIEIEKLQKKLEELKKEKSEISIKTEEYKKQSKEKIEQEKENLKEKEEIELKQVDEIVEKAKENISKLKQEDLEPYLEDAKEKEGLKSYINQYERAMIYQDEIKELKKESYAFTLKIEKARELPGELLKNADLPVKNLSLVNGEILINNLPIDNLSDGEKLRLAVKIAEVKSGELKVVFVDGFEKLDKIQQDLFIEEAKETNLQWFITKVSDNELEIKTY